MDVFQPDLHPASTTDPLHPDSDGDGINAGVEDTNHNGRVDPGETYRWIYTSNTDISVDKSVNISSPKVDENIVFAITVINNGLDYATGVQVTEQVPAGLTYLSDDSGGILLPRGGMGCGRACKRCFRCS